MLNSFTGCNAVPGPDCGKARALVVQVLEWLTNGYYGPDIPGEQLTVISTLQDATEALGERWADEGMIQLNKQGRTKGLMTIQISIIPGVTPHEVEVSATGREEHLMTADICGKAWGIEDLASRAAEVIKAWGYENVRIDEVLFDPSSLNLPAELRPGGKGVAAFAQTNYPVYVSFAPTDARLRKIQLEVVLADRVVWDNRGNPDVRHFEASMSVVSENSVSSEWSRSTTLGISAEIGTSIGPIDASTSISYEDTIGESHGETRGQSVSFSNTISGDLEPGELQVAAGTQQRGFATVGINFALSLVPYSALKEVDTRIGFKGNVRVGNQAAGYNDYDRFTVDFRDILRHYRKSLSPVTSRVDTIGVFADADFRSYPIPDTSQESIDAVAGVHSLMTTYQGAHR